MEKEIELIDKLIKRLREIKSLHAKNLKLSEKDTSDMTQKKREKYYNDMGWNAADRIKREHEAHAICVELGFAEKRDDYSEITLYPDHWHKFNYKPREPFEK